jgi:hypothetical protein
MRGWGGARADARRESRIRARQAASGERPPGAQTRQRGASSAGEQEPHGTPAGHRLGDLPGKIIEEIAHPQTARLRAT